MRTLTSIALIVLIIGGLNWLAVGLAQYDVVAALFGGQTAVVSRMVYALVGVAAIIVILALPTLLLDDRTFRTPGARGTKTDPARDGFPPYRP